MQKNLVSFYCHYLYSLSLYRVIDLLSQLLYVLAFTLSYLSILSFFLSYRSIFHYSLPLVLSFMTHLSSHGNSFYRVLLFYHSFLLTSIFASSHSISPLSLLLPKILSCRDIAGDSGSLFFL